MSCVEISIILPVYNGSEFLEETLNSLLQQSNAPRYEIIVVDDESTDDSGVVIRSFQKKYGDVIRVLEQKNSGVSKARNNGISAASGKLIAFIDQDDLWDSDKLHAQYEAIHSDPELSMVCSRQYYFLQEGERLPSWCKSELINRDHVGYILGATLVRREVFDQLGMLDEAHSYTDDVKWFFTAKDNGCKILHLPDAHLKKRIHGTNNSASVGKLHRELLQIVKASIQHQKMQSDHYAA